MSYTPTKVGIIGCGKISETYAPNAKRFGVFDLDEFLYSPKSI